MGNFTSQLPTMFWILKSKNLAAKPSFCTTRAYFLAANLDCSSLEKWWVERGIYETKGSYNTFEIDNIHIYLIIYLSIRDSLQWQCTQFWINSQMWKINVFQALVNNKKRHRLDLHCKAFTLREWLCLISWLVSKGVRFWPLGSSADHLPRAEDECCGPGFSYSHDNCSKTLKKQREGGRNLPLLTRHGVFALNQTLK